MDKPAQHIQYDGLAKYKPVSFGKNDMVFQAGQACQHMLYITSGVVRAFYIYDDKEVNLRLTASDNVALQYQSFITGEPANEYIQCLSDCEGYLIPISNAVKQQQSDAKQDYSLRVLAENHYLAIERRLYTLQLKSGLERYRYFLQTMPQEIINKTPSQHVASYLGLTPESFSRIKRQLNK